MHANPSASTRICQMSPLASFGLGADGYSYALQTAVKRLSQSH